MCQLRNLVYSSPLCQFEQWGKQPGPRGYAMLRACCWLIHKWLCLTEIYRSMYDWWACIILVLHVAADTNLLQQARLVGVYHTCTTYCSRHQSTAADTTGLVYTCTTYCSRHQSTAADTTGGDVSYLYYILQQTPICSSRHDWTGGDVSYLYYILQQTPIYSSRHDWWGCIILVLHIAADTNLQQQTRLVGMYHTCTTYCSRHQSTAADTTGGDVSYLYYILQQTPVYSSRHDWWGCIILVLHIAADTNLQQQTRLVGMYHTCTTYCSRHQSTAADTTGGDVSYLYYILQQTPIYSSRRDWTGGDVSYLYYILQQTPIYSSRHDWWGCIILVLHIAADTNLQQQTQMDWRGCIILVLHIAADTNLQQQTRLVGMYHTCTTYCSRHQSTAADTTGGDVSYLYYILQQTPIYNSRHKLTGGDVSYLYYILQQTLLSGVYHTCITYRCSRHRGLCHQSWNYNDWRDVTAWWERDHIRGSAWGNYAQIISCWNIVPVDWIYPHTIFKICTAFHI